MKPLFAIQFTCLSRFLLAAALPCPAADRPNIVFLLTDDQRADALACYGNSSTRSPRAACGLRMPLSRRAFA
jgi:hypothetical protein